VSDAVLYAIGDLADLAGVSRRTVRYYVQEGLLPAPLGLGRGSHYGPAHLEQLLKVKAMQEAGRTLDEIKQALSGKGGANNLPSRSSHRQWERAKAGDQAAESGGLPERSVWRRIGVAPGVELHVSAGVRLPSPGKLNELAAWCRAHFHPVIEEEDSDA
jgi:DNA-binding transcriptional MerR regulator